MSFHVADKRRLGQLACEGHATWRLQGARSRLDLRRHFGRRGERSSDIAGQARVAARPPDRRLAGWRLGTSARPALAAASCAACARCRLEAGSRPAGQVRAAPERRAKRVGHRGQIGWPGALVRVREGPTASECRTAAWPVNWPRNATRSGARRCAPTLSACILRARECARNQTCQAWRFLPSGVAGTVGPRRCGASHGHSGDRGHG